MADPYIGEIRMFGGTFPPQGWMTCDGQLVAISSYPDLYTLIGVTYGGDGVNTFGLPNLTARLPIHQGTSQSGTTYLAGQIAGTTSVQLNTAQLPAHPHNFMAAAAPANQSSPANAYVAAATQNVYAPTAPAAQMNASSIGFSGNGAPHDNMMPYLPITFIISMFGIYPTQS